MKILGALQVSFIMVQYSGKPPHQDGQLAFIDDEFWIWAGPDVGKQKIIVQVVSVAIPAYEYTEL